MTDSSKQFTPEEFNVLVSLARRALYADPEVQKALQQQNVFISPANFYSNIPLIEEVESSFELNIPDGPYNSPAVFNQKVMLDFLGEIDKFADEFDPPKEGDRENPDGF